MEYSLETRCLHLEEEKKKELDFGSVSFPIYQTATFAHWGVGQSTGYDYTRLQNPTREQTEKIVASLERGVDAIGFCSGMAAVTALMELFLPGDHLIVDGDLYGGTIRLFNSLCESKGIEITSIELAKEDPHPYIKENTKAIYVETPTNPMMNVADIRKLGEIAKDNGLLLIVDNTFLSPYFQNPLLLGADIVLHSGTKYLGGHNDTIAGFLVAGNTEIAEKLRTIFKTTGAGLSPFDSWLILRGIKTLSVRMERAQENALAIAQWLKEQKHVTKVLYPGLPEHPGYDIMKKQASGFGGMLTFEMDTTARAQFILNHVKLIQFAESLGGTESLITYPVTQTHADVPKDKLLANGITDRILRLSVGIEGKDDLIADLAQAFEASEDLN